MSLKAGSVSVLLCLLRNAKTTSRTCSTTRTLKKTKKGNVGFFEFGLWFSGIDFVVEVEDSSLDVSHVAETIA